jgi:hypothetical protein
MGSSELGEDLVIKRFIQLHISIQEKELSIDLTKPGRKHSKYNIK